MNIYYCPPPSRAYPTACNKLTPLLIKQPDHIIIMFEMKALLSFALLALFARQPVVVHAQPQITLGPGHDATNGTSCENSFSGCAITDIQKAPGDDTRLFVVLKNGIIKILRDYMDPNPQYDDIPFLDIRGTLFTQCTSDDQCPTAEINEIGNEKCSTPLNTCHIDENEGLLGLAFHPNFQQNKLFYLHYTTANGPASSASRGKLMFASAYLCPCPLADV